MSAKNILRKLSIAKLNGAQFMKELTKLGQDKPDSAPIFVARILGSVRSATVGQSNFGDYIEFTGSFVGFDAQGNEYRAPKAFLVSPADEMLKEALDARPEESKNAPIEFAFDISVVPDPKEGSRGYQYRVAALTESKEADPLAALLTNVAPLALAAPADTAHVPEANAETAAPAKGSKK
jgi:hypothetical protein